MVILSTSLLVFLISANEAVPCRVWKAGMGLRGQGQFPPEGAGVEQPHSKGQGHTAKVWRLDRSVHLGKTGCSFSDSPRPRNYDIYRVPSSQSVEDHGYVPQKKTEDLHTPRCLPGPHHLPSRDTHVGLFGRLGLATGELTVLPTLPALTPPPT